MSLPDDPNHTDPVRVLLTVERIRDPLLRAMGEQLTMKERELDLANEEIRRQAKRISDLEHQAAGKPIGIQRTETPPDYHPHPATEASIDPAPAKVHWIIAALRECGPLTIAGLGAHRGVTDGAVYQAMRDIRDQITDDGKRPKTYSLKARP